MLFQVSLINQNTSSPAIPTDENDKPTASPEGYYSDLFLPYFL